jgi:hypothetical protein
MCREVPHVSKLAILAIILSGIFLSMLTTIAFAIAWLVFGVILRWAGSGHRRSIVIGRCSPSSGVQSLWW